MADDDDDEEASLCRPLGHRYAALWGIVMPPFGLVLGVFLVTARVLTPVEFPGVAGVCGCDFFLPLPFARHDRRPLDYYYFVGY